MSPELRDYYRTKQRKMAFYIVENELNNEETPPEVSAVIGLDKELASAFYAARRPPMEKPAMECGIRVNRDTHSVKKEKEIVKKKLTKRDGMHCPSLPTQWRSNLDNYIPRAQF